MESASEIKINAATPVLPIPTDVRDPLQVEQLINRIIAELGQLDVLFNNADLYRSSPIEPIWDLRERLQVF